MTVPYEEGLRTGNGFDDILDDPELGITVYDSGIPGQLFSDPVFHPTDDTEQGIYRTPTDVVEWNEIVYDVPSTNPSTGMVDRNAYILGAFEIPDAHDFRGDHPLIERTQVEGSYGAAGSDTDDYTIQYAQGVGAKDWSDPTDDEQYDAMSLGY